MALQVAKAKKALRQAISTVNVGEHAEIKKAAARACVNFGLKQRAQAFELVPVSFLLSDRRRTSSQSSSICEPTPNQKAQECV